MNPLMARMGWNPDSPTNARRVSLLVYLRQRLSQLEALFLPPAALSRTRKAEMDELRHWIAWLNGEEVPV